MNAATASLLVPLLLLPVCPLAAQQPIVTGDRVRIVAPNFAVYSSHQWMRSINACATASFFARRVSRCSPP